MVLLEKKINSIIKANCSSFTINSVQMTKDFLKLVRNEVSKKRKIDKLKSNRKKWKREK